MALRLLLASFLLTACSHQALVPQDEADDAERYYAMKRQGTDDPQRAYAVARAQLNRFHIESAVPQALSWTALGPGNIGGRTRTLVIDPIDPNVMYAGGVSGGIWKTTNAGAEWTPIGDDLVNLAVNSLVMDPNDHNVLYAGTGEGYFREEVRGTGLPLRGNGMFVTRDGGATWDQLSSTANDNFAYVNDLAISPHDSRRIYAATRTGVWRSDDAGNSWKQVLATSVKGGCLDLAMRTDTPSDVLFASCGTLDQATVYRATNDTWTTVLSEPDMGRTTLAIAPSHPSTIYALSASNTDQALLAVFRSDANGDPGTWTARVRRDDSKKVNTLLLTNPITASSKECSGQSGGSPTTMGWYCNTIAVDPTNPDRVFAAGVDLFRSDDGGANWGIASYWWGVSKAKLHSDQHNIVFDPHYDAGSNQTIYFTNDGGVYRTDNALASVATGDHAPCDPANSSMQFVSLDHNFGVTQFYHGAVFPDGRRYLGGAQDNSTLLGSIDGGPNWSSAIGGDGAFVAVDPADPRFVYGESQYANIVRSDDGGATFSTSVRHGLNDDFLFVTPFIIDTNQTTRLWIGGRRLWRTDDRGITWSVASTTLSAQVTAIAAAPHDSKRVVAGTTDGSVYMTASATSASGSTQWTRVKPRDGWLSSIAFDPSNTSILYATYAGFGGKHVWKSSDSGTTWTAIDAGLPDMPVHSIAIEPSRPDHLYLGTDLGVLISTDGGAHWSTSGLVAVVTEWVTIAQGERGPAVYAFTHGRGAWRAELAPATRRRSIRP